MSDYTLHHGDCLEIMPTLPKNRYVIVTDPPYGTGGWRRTAIGAGRDPRGSLSSALNKTPRTLRLLKSASLTPPIRCGI